MKTKVLIGIVLGCAMMNATQIDIVETKVMDKLYEKAEFNEAQRLIGNTEDSILCPEFRDGEKLGGF